MGDPKVIWKQENDLEPLIDIFFDTTSRQGLVQIVLENRGGGNAYDIKITWKNPLFNSEGKEIHFNKRAGDTEIPIINKGQKYSLFVGSIETIFRFSNNANTILDYTGVIYYKKNREDKQFCETNFFISLEPYRDSLLFDNEELNFYFEGAKIHGDLRKISNSLDVLITELNNRNIPKSKTGNL